jgi:uncharacterized membrane protein
MEAQYEIDRAKAQAQTFANGVVDDTAGYVDGRRQGLLQELCEIRDSYVTLTQAAKAGRLTAAEFSSAISELETAEVSCTRQVQEIATNVATVTAIEEDSLAYADSYASRNPTNQYDFSF